MFPPWCHTVTGYGAAPGRTGGRDKRCTYLLCLWVHALYCLRASLSPCLRPDTHWSPHRGEVLQSGGHRLFVIRKGALVQCVCVCVCRKLRLKKQRRKKTSKCSNISDTVLICGMRHQGLQRGRNLQVMPKPPGVPFTALGKDTKDSKPEVFRQINRSIPRHSWQPGLFFKSSASGNTGPALTWHRVWEAAGHSLPFLGPFLKVCGGGPSALVPSGYCVLSSPGWDSSLFKEPIAPLFFVYIPWTTDSSWKPCTSWVQKGSGWFQDNSSMFRVAKKLCKGSKWGPE